MFHKNLRTGSEIWGVELNNAEAQKASQTMQNVLIGKYDEVADKLPDEYFDLVICNDVIEHMENHDAYFDSIKKKLTPEGRLIGSIPNGRYYLNLYELLFKKDWRYRDQGLLDSTHLRFFTERSLKRTLEDHAFDIDKFEGINSAKHSPSILKRIMKEVFFYSVSIITLGLYRDIQYPQFGFRVQKRKPSNIGCR